MKIGLVLSGGVARGIAHIGIVKFLEEKQVKINAISGVSAGSIIGAFMAAEYSYENILKILKGVNFFTIMRLSFSSGGFLKSEKIQALYEKYLPKTFEELSIPLTISATDVSSGNTVFFDKGDLYKPILASCCVPMVFEPVRIDEAYLVDGGMLNNLPVEPLVNHCDRIIGVHVNPTNDQFKTMTMTKITTRCIELAVKCNVEVRKKHCDIFVEPEKLKTYSMYDISHIDELVVIGYDGIKDAWNASIPLNADLLLRDLSS
jgi:NTE family protein